MSKKSKVLSESTIRRFMKLANIESLSENFVQEAMPDHVEEMGAAPEQEGMLPEEEVEVGLEDDGGKEAKVRELINLIAEISGIEMDVSGEEGEQEVDGAGDMMGAAGALDAGGEGEEEGEEEEGEEDEGGEEEMNEAAEDLEEQEEVEESASASEDAMVESIVRRVTARLIEEAKKGRKMTAKQKMALKKAQAKKGGKKEEKEDKKAAKPVEEATAATGGGPLLKKGGNKHDVWAGTPDMKLAKGEKGGAGGHKLSPLKGTKKNAV